jgi:1,4-dihydroxy-2-naphthoate octaprenyltransferase
MLLGLGLAAIAAAILYTMGSSAYGYKGLGDLFVFVFFGAVPVFGTVLLMGGDPYLPYPPRWFTTALYPAIAMGCFSVAVLNVNNYRDLDSDAAAGKRTLAVRLGASKTLQYHRVLLILGWICLGKRRVGSGVRPLCAHCPAFGPAFFSRQALPTRRS